MMNVDRRIFFLLIGLLALNACAFTPQQALLAPKIQIAETNIGLGTEIALRIVDERADKTIGHRGGAYFKGAKITSEQDVPALINEKVIEGLRKKGFRPVVYQKEFPKSLKVEIRLLQYSTSTGFWTGGIHMKSTLKAVAKKDGKEYENIYRVDNEKRVFFVPGSSKNEQIINQAISEVLQKLFQDQELISFLAE